MPILRERNCSPSRAVLTAALVAGVLGASPRAAFAVHPWLARRPPAQPPAAHQLNDVGRWPAEPPSPAEVDPARFRVSVEHLCAHRKTDDEKTSSAPASGPRAPASAAALGDLTRAAAEEAGVDPFLLAGLIFEQSACRASLESPLGTGLLRISPALYRSPGAPPPPGEPTDWTKRALLDPAANLRLGAKLLRMWQDTHVEEDALFRGVPHRGPAAHFIWGDVVHSSGGEDQALTARRRLIDFYANTPEASTQTSLGVALISPLEGAPRVATSGPGEDRAGGKRQHRGLDLAAAIGEPVRSVANGTVIFAGANVPGAPRRSLTPAVIGRYRWRRLGPGGIYVCIEHAPDRHIVSCYMHLDTYTVTEGDTVTADQEIGRVGRTGVQISPPHLHFELRVDDRHVDPTRYLAALVIPPKATQTYRHVMLAKRMRLAKARSERGARGESQKL